MYVAKIGKCYLKKAMVDRFLQNNFTSISVTFKISEAYRFERYNPELALVKQLIDHGFKFYKLNEAEVRDQSQR